MRQIKLRAVRLNVPEDNISLVARERRGRDLRSDRIDETRFGRYRFDPDDALHGYFVVVRHGQSGQGELGALFKCSKTLEIPTFIVGHVNKDGAIAGPKVMEHIVDTVLYFEGDKTLPYRVLRAVKNRYGSTK